MCLLYCEGWTGWRDYWTMVPVLYSRGKPVSAVDRRQGYSRLMYAYKQLLLQTYVWKKWKILLYIIVFITLNSKLLKFSNKSWNSYLGPSSLSEHLRMISELILQELPWIRITFYSSKEKIILLNCHISLRYFFN